MRMVLNGVEGAELSIFKDAETVLNILSIADDGTKNDETGNTLTLELYDTRTRANAASVSLATVATTVAAGFFSCTISEVALAALVAGRSYYGFLKKVTTGTVTSYSNKPALLTMG